MTLHFQDETVTLWHGDALQVLAGLPDASVDCCVTSPPYFQMRDYDIDGQIGDEPTPAEYIDRLRDVFHEVRRVLATDGTCWINLGDSYAHKRPSGPQGTRGLRATRTFTAAGAGGGAQVPDKNLLGMPWRLAFALQDDGWIVRNDIIWEKLNGIPESVKDRLSTRYEHVFLLSRSKSYWFDLDPIRAPHSPESVARAARAFHADTQRGYVGAAQTLDPSQFLHEGGKNPGDVWALSTKPFAGAHFAVMPVDLAERCILAGCKPGGTVLDPFSGTGTTGLAAALHDRKYVGIDLNVDYLRLSLRTRLAQPGLNFEAGRHAA